MMKMTTTKLSHAIVIGGSMAGLLTSRILLNHFERVTLIERDVYPEKPDYRPGVAQARQLHQLMVRANIILESLFPGIEQELLNLGAEQIDWPKDVLIVYGSQTVPRFSFNLRTLFLGRPLLDWTIKSRLKAFKGFHFIEGHEVTDLLYDTEQKSVTGVLLGRSNNTKNDNNSSINSLVAELVVDTTGRATRTHKWLASCGYTSPQKTVVDASIGYASRLYEPAAGFIADWKAIQMWPRPPYLRGGGIYPVGNNLWHVGLIGINGDYPLTDEAGFLEFSKTLPGLQIYEAIKLAKPVSEIYSYRQTQNRLYHYEKLSQMPESFIALGDAVCAFNPVYGQGITVAALSAVILDELLQEEKYKKGKLTGFSIQFQKKLAKELVHPWLLATLEDFNWSKTKGIKPQPWFAYKLIQKYTNKLLQQAAREPDICQLFGEVMHMLKPTYLLFSPQIFWRVLQGSVIKTPETITNTISRKI
jgi:flavin-dependent dehydrogenase